MPRHGACNLGSINLSAFVKNPFTEDAYFDYLEFGRAVRVAIEALDTVLDENMNNHPLPQQKEMAFNYRNVGLGIMGLHDCLIKMGITYGDASSRNIINNIMRNMCKQAIFKSCDLAKEKGRFPKYNDSVLDADIIRDNCTKGVTLH